MNSREFICRVKALYPYESNDSSSLSFKAGAIIEVFSQLDSGWWDGRYGGKRGWFPSNYVQVLPDDPNPQPSWKRELDPEMQKQLRISLHATDMLLSQQQQQQQQQSAWILQTTEDGSEKYYFNIQTQEMRNTMPSDYHPKGTIDRAFYANQSNGSIHDAFQQQQQEERPPVRPVRAASRGITESFYGGDFRGKQRNLTDYSYLPSRSSPTVPYAQSQSPIEAELNDDSIKLPPNWIRKTTPKGRFYYGNIKTDERAWDLEDIDPVTGTLLNKTPSTPVSPARSVYSAYESISKEVISTQEHGGIEEDIGPITWQNVSIAITQAIVHLKEAVRQGKQATFSYEHTLVVHRIRTLLYVTNCVDKETSPHLKNNKQLRTLHRALLAAVAKLVLSAKVASYAWRTPESLAKLASDADDCLVSVRHFIAFCQDLDMSIQDKKPVLQEASINSSSSHRPGHLKHTGLVHGAPETAAILASLAEKVHDALGPYRSNMLAMLGAADTIHANAPLCVAQCRNLSNTLSQFLNVVQDIYPNMAKAKAPILAAMGALFIVSQTITSTHIIDLTAAVDRINECTRMIEVGVQQVMDAIDDVDKQVPPLSPQPSTYIGDVMLDDHMSEDVWNVMKTEEIVKRSTAASSSASVVSAPSTPTAAAAAVTMENAWFLSSSESDVQDMVYTTEGNVKGGTLHGLVQHLTQHDQLDSKFNTTFLLTYRSFCTTEELFSELFHRYQLSPPEGLKPEELELWKEKKLKLVRLRVFNVIKSWLETYYNEQEDRHMLPEITRFMDEVIVETMKFGADQLSKLIKKRMMAEDSSQIRKMKLNVRTADMPVPILPKNMKRLKLLELDPQELARQMTIMDFRLYNRIKPVECLDKNWGTPDVEGQEHHIAANIKASIEHSNQVTAWVTDSILSKDEVKKRSYVVKHWIIVAERCRFLNNFNTCMAILSAFDNGSIGRLKRTWEQIGARTMAILQNIRRLMGANRNFSEYRDIIHKVNPPCIPFLGIYLQDLTFIEDGNANFLKKSNHLINFSKRMKTAEVIRDLQQHQSAHYMLQAVPDIQEFIQTHLHSSREEEELYNISLKLEPRERGEDTIARRLKESGL